MVAAKAWPGKSGRAPAKNSLGRFPSEILPALSSDPPSLAKLRALPNDHLLARP